MLYVIGVNIGGDLTKCLIFLCSPRSDDVNGGVWHNFRRQMVYYKCFFKEQVRKELYHKQGIGWMKIVKF